MEVVITRSIEALLLPPGVSVVVLLIAVLLLKSKPIPARALLWANLVILYISSMPAVAHFLIQQLENIPPLDEIHLADTPAQAIVILSAERYVDAPEYKTDTVGDNTLVRVRYGAKLHRATGLPILVSGGKPLNSKGRSLASAMSHTLTTDFNIGNVWLEEQSRTTGENALFTQRILTEKNINTILLVTHAWHMPRSVAVFEKYGLRVIAAPTRFTTRRADGPALLAFLPNAKAIQLTHWALHELIGRLWYAVRY